MHYCRGLSFTQDPDYGYIIGLFEGCMKKNGFDTKNPDFIWNKKDELKDAWLDNIDWVKIREKSKAEKDAEEEADEAEEEAQSAYSELNTYRTMVEMMKPGESVAKTLRRLGGKKAGMSASQRWKKKKAGAVEDPEEKENKEKMLRLTGLADTILTRSGNMEIYEETFESITHKIKSEQEKKVGPKTSIPEGVDDDDALDMFADSLDDNSTPKESEPPKPTVPRLEEEVMWEFKWKEEDNEVHGPHPSQSMLDWQESGYFSDGVLVRKVGTEEFRSSKRIDFELYV